MVGAALCTADFFLKFSSCYLEKLAEKTLDSTKYLLQLALSVGVRVHYLIQLIVCKVLKLGKIYILHH